MSFSCEIELNILAIFFNNTEIFIYVRLYSHKIKVTEGFFGGFCYIRMHHWMPAMTQFDGKVY